MTEYFIFLSTCIGLSLIGLWWWIINAGAEPRQGHLVLHRDICATNEGA
jgi:hypothetical protein